MINLYKLTVNSYRFYYGKCIKEVKYLMQILNFKIPSHDLVYITCDESIPEDNLLDDFFLPIKRLLTVRLDTQTDKYPHIDFDTLKNDIIPILDQLTATQTKALRKLGYAGRSISAAEWNKAREHKAIMLFLWFYPHFANLLTNVHLLAAIVIRATELHFLEPINTKNFVLAKKFIDKINRERWTRAQSQSEQQSGVSNLGQVSETLLEKALGELIDGKNFFKTNNQKVQSYGDFVLMCLPNNLWLSVKSNFARERLLASGYTTDILGVGFFTSADEFISAAKVRNFQRVGFLAMYLPEIPISEQQIENNTNTFEQVVAFYRQNAGLPKNINGTNFIRPLSQLHEDLHKMLEIDDVAKRTTIDF